MESAPDNALDYSDSRLASTFATSVYMYARVSMGLTVSRQKRSVIFHRHCQPSKVPIDMNCQKVSRHFKSCFFSISADRHGLLLLKNPAPNWKTNSHVLKTLLQDITKPKYLLISENISKFYK